MGFRTITTLNEGIDRMFEDEQEYFNGNTFHTYMLF